jgi:hypothetical protein
MMVYDNGDEETPINKSWLDLSEMERDLIWEIMWNVNDTHKYEWTNPENYERRSPPEPRAQYAYIQKKVFYHVEVDISGPQEVRISVTSFPLCGRFGRFYMQGVGNSVKEYCDRHGMAVPFYNFEKWSLPGCQTKSMHVPVKLKHINELQANFEYARKKKIERDANNAANDKTEFLWTAVSSINPFGSLARFEESNW